MAWSRRRWPLIGISGVLAVLPSALANGWLIELRRQVRLRLPKADLAGGR